MRKTTFSSFRWLKNQRKAVVTTVDKKIPNGILEEQDATVVLLPRSASAAKNYPPLAVEHLEDEYRLRSADDGKLFREEYNSLPGGHAQGTYEEASKDNNKDKNRYPNILPYDHSRVVLTQLEGSSDYVNASYIDGFTVKNKFIAAQGPKEDTVADFWRMIWEQKVSTVVMLTNLKERKEDKCYQYWPDQGCWTYGNVRVAVEDFTVLVDYTIRKFCIQYQSSDAAKTPRLITQLHFTSWPDFGVPFSPIGMLKFLKKVKAVNPQFAGPIVVHCSAGVGRTGTFIVIDGMIDMMHAEQKVDVFGFVSKIREQRSQLIQTDMQYSFIYQALLEYYLYGDTELDVSSLEGHLHKLHNTFNKGDRVGLEEEFKKLTNMRIMKENMRTGNLPANMKKNRVLQIIPYDFNRVILSMRRGQEFTDYVNASFIDVSPFYGIPTEGLLHRHAGPAAAHRGGLLEDGVGVEVSLHRHAHRAPGEGAGQVLSVLARGGVANVRRLRRGDEGRRLVRHFQPARLGTHLPAGEADARDPALPLPRLARGGHPGRGAGHDRHHRGGAAAAAAVGQPSHRGALQRRRGADRYVRCTEQHLGARQGRRPAGRLPNCQEFTHAEAAHGPDGGAVRLLLQGGTRLCGHFLRLCQLQMSRFSALSTL
ncbi:receptor-type tyrosine-protein phosphatase epsilon isoform X3 [Phycodurus eques]|uniref:receptor-type tyrosine-protein phosphatase epsilon isoform X3 n=1 Tax=Phycodurus eques TaxID=693459 RepID=UPI002ACDE601|nr:receptor-type tyrosine-protein phosphatase epsilon isoform X3 [Phycodurus eques]